MNVVIIGGGIAGLSAAYQLHHIAPELTLTLVEASAQWGGKIATEHVDGFLIESGPDCFLSRKPHGIALCESLGIADQLIGRDPDHAKTFVLRDGRLHPLPSGLTGMIPTQLDALTNSSLLSAEGIAHVTQEPTLPPRPGSDDESVASFISRRLGREAFDHLVEPLMGGICAGQADQLSLAAMFPQLRRLEQEHGSLLKGLNLQQPAPAPLYPPFVSFKNGMQTLVDALVGQLTGVDLRLNVAVTHVDPIERGYLLQLSGPKAEPLHAEAVIITTPAFVSSQLLSTLDAEWAATLLDIPYASTALVNLAFDEADLPVLDGYGYLIPRIEQREALACTWTSRKWRDRAPSTTLLLRVYVGRYDQTDVTQYEDDRLLDIARDEIRSTLQIDTPPLFHRIIRYPNALPQYNMGHLDRIDSVNCRLAQHPGLFMAGAMFNGVGIPDCIASGETAATHVLQYLRSH